MPKNLSMTQLLISVKNVEEALQALEVGVDIVDLKDPNVGALGALGLHPTERIVLAINGRGLLSATVGENHASLDELIVSVQARAHMGVDIIKIGVSALFYTADFFTEMRKLTGAGAKIVAVFFVDEEIDFNLLETLQKIGFYGAMLDTQTKQFSLLEILTQAEISKFVHLCSNFDLVSGLAGSLKAQHIEIIREINPTYIGFRGGVCENLKRESALSENKVVEVKSMLRQHNKNKEKAQRILRLALHS